MKGGNSRFRDTIHISSRPQQQFTDIQMIIPTGIVLKQNSRKFPLKIFTDMRKKTMIINWLSPEKKCIMPVTNLSTFAKSINKSWGVGQRSLKSVYCQSSSDIPMIAEQNTERHLARQGQKICSSSLITR